MRSANLLIFGDHGKQDRLEGCNSDPQNGHRKQGLQTIACKMGVDPEQESQMYQKNTVGEHWRKESLHNILFIFKESTGH